MTTIREKYVAQNTVTQIYLLRDGRGSPPIGHVLPPRTSFRRRCARIPWSRHCPSGRGTARAHTRPRQPAGHRSNLKEVSCTNFNESYLSFFMVLTRPLAFHIDPPRCSSVLDVRDCRRVVSASQPPSTVGALVGGGALLDPFGDNVDGGLSASGPRDGKVLEPVVGTFFEDE